MLLDMADKVRTMSMPVKLHYSSSTYHVMACKYIYKQEDPSFFSLQHFDVLMTITLLLVLYAPTFTTLNKKGKRKCEETFQMYSPLTFITICFGKKTPVQKLRFKVSQKRQLKYQMCIFCWKHVFYTYSQHSPDLNCLVTALKWKICFWEVLYKFNL